MCLAVCWFTRGVHGLQGASMVRQSWSDEDLTHRLQQRDPEALETLISRYSREVFYFIRLVFAIPLFQFF